MYLCFYEKEIKEIKFVLHIVVFRQSVYNKSIRFERSFLMELVVLGGGLLIIIFAVIVSVVSSVVSAIAANEDIED